MSSAELASSLVRVKASARALRATESARKDQALGAAARLLGARSKEILQANAADLAALDAQATAAFRDRLTLSAERVSHMTESLKQVAALADPVGELVDHKRLANGLKVSRVRSPLGVILMIYESRPNVAIEAFSLGFKAGNAMILRGGKESMRTTSVLYEILHQALAEAGLPADCLWGLTDPDRGITDFLLKQKKWIDVVVPRGGERLIEHVTTHSLIPIIKNDRGMCHIFVSEDANLENAIDIIINAKCQRPGVCNSMETLLVHKKVGATFLPGLHDRIPVQWRACPETLKILQGRPRVQAATPEDWDTEHLDLIMNCKAVESLDEAIAHIEAHGSRHSEAILTRSKEAALRFQNEIDAAAVYWNASTRFTDGFELGLGGELGISTQKLHVRGPVGLRELTSVRWILEGEGQIRK